MERGSQVTTATVDVWKVRKYERLLGKRGMREETWRRVGTLTLFVKLDQGSGGAKGVPGSAVVESLEV